MRDTPMVRFCFRVEAKAEPPVPHETAMVALTGKLGSRMPRGGVAARAFEPLGAGRRSDR
jgi:hypothetical protein